MQALVGTPDGRPVSRLHTETALAQLPGIGELIHDALAAAEEAAPNDQAVAALVDRLRIAAGSANEALSRAETILRDEVLPRSAGEGRLGPELFAAKLRRTLRDAELTPARILGASRPRSRCGPGRDDPAGTGAVGRPVSGSGRSGRRSGRRPGRP